MQLTSYQANRAIQLAALGYSATEIARILRISYDTARAIYRNLPDIKSEKGQIRSRFERNIDPDPFVFDPEPQPKKQKTEMGDKMNVGRYVGSNEQYVSVIRHSRDRFGRKKRISKKYMVKKMKENDVKLRSLFQQCEPGSFTAGFGTIGLPNVESQAPAGAMQLLPVQLWDITSLPQAMYSAVDPTSHTAVSYKAMPLRHHVLTAENSASVSGIKAKNFRWVTVNAGKTAKVTNVDGPELPPATVTDNKWFPNAKAFKHDWTHVKLCFHAANGFPCRYHMALVTFPTVNGQYWGPDQAYLEPTDTISYQRIAKYGLSNNTVNSNETYMSDQAWNMWLSGRLKHPLLAHNVFDNADDVKHIPQPFKILKHKSFYLPAQDHPEFSGTGGIRVLEDFFYEKDWHYTITENDLGVTRATLLNNLTHENQPTAYDTYTSSSPFAPQSPTVYLMVWAEHYKSRISSDQTIQQIQKGTVLHDSNDPTLDIVLRMKHTISEHDGAVSDRADVMPTG